MELLIKLLWMVLCCTQQVIHVSANTVSVASPVEVRQSPEVLQDIVTWDEYSYFVRGERILFYSAEFHPFRLPVSDLWLDVFQKIKSLSYNGVSFYIDWALLEGEQGTFRAEGIFGLQEFFDAATEAGIYLLARPGPYINAEVSGGGFPGWLTRVNGTFRTNATGFLEATDLYMKEVGGIIANAQITNGGPVVLVQAENEYTYPANNITFPDSDYFQYVIDQLRNTGIVVPIINNDASPRGIFAPGNTSVQTHVDVYGYDNYALGFTCSTPEYWPDNSIPTNFAILHEQQSPSTPHSIIEFQGGSFDPWGGYGLNNCAAFTGEAFERVFYKNNWSFRVTFFNIYMTYGGTNWGNLGHPLGYTSYDYGAPITEDRSVVRAKYSETKLGANFLRASPSYLTSTVTNYTNETYTNTPDIAVTALIGNGSDTSLYVVRHAAYNSNSSTSYIFTAPSSIGNITIPQLNQLSDHLTLNGRDSKVHVVDYDMDGIKLLYSSADIFTWQKYESKKLLVLYGGENETHEFAVPSSQCNLTNGAPESIAMDTRDGYDIVQWQVQEAARVVQCTNLTIHLLWRNDAYNWWVLELPANEPLSNFSSLSKTSVVVNGGYLMRTAQIADGSLYLTGDINQTTTIDVPGSPTFNTIYFNGQDVGSAPALINYTEPQIDLPDLSTLEWKSLNSLPELASSYVDSSWTTQNRTQTFNQFRPTTSEVLYASDYGYHSGSLLYRGHFTTPEDTSSPLNLSLITQGGYAYGYSLWLNATSVYQYPGISTRQNDTHVLQLSDLSPNENYVITILIDHMGLTENFNPGDDTMREPRGLLSYNLTETGTSSSVPVTWKLTGNLGGESYIDKTRGPLNEGGMFFERQGFHLPNAPTNNTAIFPSTDSPFTGFAGPGLHFYVTQFNLDLPTPEYDIPLWFVFTNTSTDSSRNRSPTRFRSQLYVNGFQFGKYVNHIGPQLAYPVPEGILNYRGANHVGVSLWSLEDANVQVQLGGLKLTSSSTPVMSGRGRQIGLSYQLPQDGWSERPEAY